MGVLIIVNYDGVAHIILKIQILYITATIVDKPFQFSTAFTLV